MTKDLTNFKPCFTESNHGLVSVRFDPFIGWHLGIKTAVILRIIVEKAMNRGGAHALLTGREFRERLYFLERADVAEAVEKLSSADIIKTYSFIEYELGGWALEATLWKDYMETNAVRGRFY